MTEPTLMRVRRHGPWLWRQERLAAQARRRTHAVPLGDYVRLAGRYRRVLAISAGLGLLAGLIAAALSPPVWVSGATMLASAVALDPQAPPDQAVRPRKAVTIDTEAAILLSYLVLPRAVSGTTVTPGQLARATAVTAPPNTRVIKIQVRDSDPGRAQLLTTNLADAYLDARRQLLTERRSQQVAAVQREIAVLQRQEASGDQIKGSLGSQFAADAPVDQRLAELRTNLLDLQAQEVIGGELLRAATTPRKATRQPEVPIISWLLIGLVLGGLVIAIRERRPAAPRTAADIHRLPVAGELPVALINRSGPVDDGADGWMGIADAIGPDPAVTLILRLDDGSLSGPVGALAQALRRRGYAVSAMVGDDHASPAPEGATATMLRVREAGKHLVGAGPSLAELDTTLSATQTDSVVLVLTPGTVSERDLDQAIERVNRLGIPVLGVILDLDGTSSQLVPLTRAAS